MFLEKLFKRFKTNTKYTKVTNVKIPKTPKCFTCHKELQTKEEQQDGQHHKCFEMVKFHHENF